MPFYTTSSHLRHLSGKSYKLLRQSGYIELPSQRTLRDYIHHLPKFIGFSADVDHHLVRSIDVSIERNRYMTLVMDEVHIKDLVYDKHEGELMGFINFGETNFLLDFEMTPSGEVMD